MHKKLKLLIIALVVAASPSCSETSTAPTAGIPASPFGLYALNSRDEAWMLILENGTYMLCSPKQCSISSYSGDPSRGSVRLKDFYKSELGLKLERESFGRGERTKAFFDGMVKFRMSEPLPFDLYLARGSCGDAFCFAMGNKEDGIRFVKVSRDTLLAALGRKRSDD